MGKRITQLSDLMNHLVAMVFIEPSLAMGKSAKNNMYLLWNKTLQMLFMYKCVFGIMFFYLSLNKIRNICCRFSENVIESESIHNLSNSFGIILKVIFCQTLKLSGFLALFQTCLFAQYILNINNIQQINLKKI